MGFLHDSYYLVTWKCVQAAAVGFVVFLIMKRIARKLSTAQKYNAKGKVVLITGANCGIGRSAATEFAKRDARVILACRDISKAKDAVFAIRRETNRGFLVIKQLDLASLASVRRFADDILATEERVDVLVNNAGVMGVPFSLTEDGFETTFAVNHLGHFLLTNRLLPVLKKSEPSRIIVVSSMLYKSGVINFEDLNGEKSYSHSKSYSNSKLANILFANSLSEKLHGSRVKVNSLSPGLVWTNLARYYVGDSLIKKALYQTVGRVLMRSPKQGCKTVIFCALDPSLDNVNGKFFRDCKERELTARAKDKAVARKLWEVSETLTNSKST